MIRRLAIAFWMMVCFQTAVAQEKADDKILGMYVHLGWSYHHPYAARTWSLDDWRNYLGGLRQLGYNSILIWPMLETMPEPLTTGDRRQLEKTKAIIDLAHRDFAMKAFVVLCPNIRAKNELAAKYTFENRPVYGVDEYIDPGDPEQLGKLVAWRQTLMEQLRDCDGIFMIDSDPGGYPNSTNIEFAYLMAAHRRMLDRLRPGIEIYYWAWTGWESYGRFHATGNFKMGQQAEIQDALSLIGRQHMDPWGIATHWLGYGAQIDSSMQDRVLAYNYGAIEGEPSFPYTNYGPGAYDAGKNKGRRGVFGNAQTHCIQLPNTFAFSRGALGLPAEKADYIAFADQLIEGAGTAIVAGWEALQGADIGRMKAAEKELARFQKVKLKPGKLSGLLFGDPERFVTDLIAQLRMTASLFTLREVLAKNADVRSAATTAAFAAFIAAADGWQQRHGYKSYWHWPAMTETLKSFPSAHLQPFLTDKPWWERGEGATAAERTANAYSMVQTYTPRLLEAMKATLTDLITK
ncbi:hypothetical protein [Chitinophaga caseinilytica]|uniref:Glycoside hydrolase family 5 domain-containing protein n=1 Tax=Chitinophaga caseinilytica TaxID=2267521 RepID=A0ABZ2Z1J0_9BACT